ncbi:glutathione ABC transporter permease [Bifidobacterium ramosum]|uniref:ABC transporter permease subunit n=1 Tax=Bifidobacterium ramosum TaxID=1798158 RepID=A0A6L4WZX6_9BIFI|nr:ABC transporter permease [Bifidobacterium ramosum]KAB8287755.1 glutathione ABC transporter permease [Bifidobacterium ramosum]NEG71297.1 ABC transporter permease subunit [Bifidobacterium ramosum]
MTDRGVTGDERDDAGGVTLRIPALARYCAARVGSSIVELFVLSLIVFLAIRLIPGDPAAGFFSANQSPTAEQIAQIHAKLGLDKPWYVQYWVWLAGVLHGDFGESITTPFPVGAQIAQRFPYSLELALMATLFALIIGIPFGLISGAKKGRVADVIIRGLSFVLISLPPFLVAIALLLWNSRTAKYRLIGVISFAENPLGNLQLMALPALILGLGFGAYVSRYTRSSLVDDLERPYVRTLRAIGTSDRQIAVISMRNALIPVTTVVAVELASLIGGTVIIEQVFSIPGMGSFLIESIKRSDYPSVQGAIFVIGAVYVVLNLLVDLLYPLIDPRVKVVNA